MAEAPTRALARSNPNTRPAVTGHGGNLTGAQRHEERINDMEVLRDTTVWLSPNPQDGDVYESPHMLGEGRVAITGTGLRKLFTARNGRVVVDKCRFDKIHFDDGDQDVYYAVIVIRNLEGVEEEVQGMVPVLDLTPGSDDYEELKEQCRGYRQKNGGKFVEFSPEEAAVKLRKAINQAKKNRPQMSITKGINYCIRKALHIQPSYTKEQIRDLPFIVRSREISPNLAVPEIRAAVIRQGAGAVESLFGSSVEQKALPAPSPVLADNEAIREFVDAEWTSPPHDPVTGEVVEDGVEGVEEIAEDASEDFETLCNEFLNDLNKSTSTEELGNIMHAVKSVEGWAPEHVDTLKKAFAANKRRLEKQ